MPIKHYYMVNNTTGFGLCCLTVSQPAGRAGGCGCCPSVIVTRPCQVGEAASSGGLYACMPLHSPAKMFSLAYPNTYTYTANNTYSYEPSSLIQYFRYDLPCFVSSPSPSSPFCTELTMRRGASLVKKKPATLHR